MLTEKRIKIIRHADRNDSQAVGLDKRVKGFNTIWSEHLATQGDTSRPLEQRRAIFIASDDSEAKAIVARLIQEIGFAAVDTGFLHEGGSSQQPGTAVYNKELTAGEASALLSVARTRGK